MWVWEASPCLSEFSLQAALPSGVMGPGECWALRRLAAFCLGVDTLIDPLVYEDRLEGQEFEVWGGVMEAVSCLCGGSWGYFRGL